MKNSSFERFNYAIRPAKNIERKMFCEAFGRLPRIAPLSSYRYIGFGAIGFHDFSLFHQRLGIKEMISIEGNLNAADRVENNIPYSCIEVKWGMSHTVLPILDWGKRSIVWLDYEDTIDLKKLEDISLLASRFVSGSVLVVTLPADPGSIEGNEDIAAKRLSDLRSRVGRDRIPLNLDGKALAKWGMARALRTIINQQIVKTLSNRNAPFETRERLKYFQLFNFHYQDGTKMLSTGGIFLSPEDEERLTEIHFQDLEFYRPADDSFLIDVPILTHREIKALDATLPYSAPDAIGLEWIPENERSKYRIVYRYFPTFNEVET